MPKPPTDDPDQQPLPFVAGEIARGEELQWLGIALMKLDCNIYAAQLMRWIFNVTDGGKRGVLKKSHAELAARPWGLCCHPNQVAATANQLKRAGILQVTPTWLSQGIQGANEYSIDWAGVRQVVGIGRQLQEARPPHTTCDPPHMESEGGHTTCGQYKETTFSHLPSPPNTSIDRSKTGSIELIRTIPERPQLIADALEREGVWRVAALRAARERIVAPLPPEILDRDPFAPLKMAHLGEAGTLTRWFRRQLSIVRPLTGDSHAELVLVLAAGLAALAIPRGSIRHASIDRGRIGCFITTLTRRLWGKVLWQVERADEELGALLAAYPECLTTADWPGPRAEALADVLNPEP